MFDLFAQVQSASPAAEGLPGWLVPAGGVSALLAIMAGLRGLLQTQAGTKDQRESWVAIVEQERATIRRQDGELVRLGLTLDQRVGERDDARRAEALALRQRDDAQRDLAAARRELEQLRGR